MMKQKDEVPTAASAGSGAPSPSRRRRPPPVHEIVIQEISPASSRPSFVSHQPLPSYPSPALVSQASATRASLDGGTYACSSPQGEGNSTAASSFASSFVLQPRNELGSCGSGLFLSSTGAVAVRGRKRPANSISAGGGCQDIAVRTGERLSSLLLENSSDSPPLQFAMKTESASASTAPLLESPPQRVNGKMTFEIDSLGMQGLSLQSPVHRALSYDSKSPSSSIFGGGASQAQSRASSFSLYHSGSPAGSATARGSVFRTSGSARSSPRHVPLTVLSDKRPPGESPPKNHRPPRHVGTSTLLYSLDDNKEESEDEMLISAPKLDTCLSSSSASSISTSPRRTVGAFESPEKRSQQSPRTPLPKITLTPRTAASSISRRSGGLPIFPSPNDDDGENDGDGMLDHTTRLLPGELTEESMDHLLYGFAGMSRQGMPPSPLTQQEPKGASKPACMRAAPPEKKFVAHPPEGAPRARLNKEYTQPLSVVVDSQLKSRHHLSSSSLALSIDDNDVDSQQLKAADSLLSLQSDRAGASHPWLHYGATQRSSRASDSKPPAKAKSILAPSRSGVMLKAILDSEPAAALDETGSLTESDEDEGFILSCPNPGMRDSSFPAAIEWNHPDSIRRAKQRRMCSVDDQYAVGQDLRSSSPSLAPGLASNTSLFGMDILPEEGHQSSTPRPTTPFAGQAPLARRTSSGIFNRLRRRDSEEAINGLLRGRSELSLGSLGLSLEAVDDTGRELVTPPVTSLQNRALSPPPLPARSNGGDFFPSQAELSPPVGGVPWA